MNPRQLDFDLPEQVVSGTFAKLGGAVLGFLGMLVYANVLGPTSFGGVVFFLVVLEYLRQPMDGWENAVQKYVSTVDADPGEGLGLLFLFAGIWTAVLVLPIAAASGMLAEQTGLEHVTLLAVAYLLTTATHDSTYAVLQGMGYVSLGSWVETVKRSTSVLARVAAVLAFGAVGMLYGIIATAVVFFPIVIYLVGSRPVVPSLQSVRQRAAFAKHRIPSSILGAAAKRIDILMLGTLATTAAVGRYEVAWQLTIPGIFFAEAMSSAIFTRISALDSVGSDVRETLRMGAYGSVLALPVFFGAVAIGDRVVDLFFSSAYEGVTLFVVGLSFYRVLRCQSDPLESMLDALNRPDTVFRSTFVTFVVNVVAGYALLVTYGPVGIVVATILAELVRYFVMQWYLRSLVDGLHVSYLRPLADQLLAAGVMYVVIAGVEDVLPGPRLVGTLALLATGAGAYFVALLALSTEHRSLARRIVTGYVSD